MLLTEKIKGTDFSPGEQVIVDLILTEGLAIEDLTTSQIAQQTYSSKSTLVRIAQKLDFQGWRDFKQAFLKELDYLNKHFSQIDANYPFDATDDDLTIAHKLASLKKEVLDDTLSLLDSKSLKSAVDLLDKARTIHIFAASNNLLLTQEFALQMNRIGRDVRVHSLHAEQPFNAFLARTDSCALIISYTGETESLLTASQILKKHGIPILLLTGLGENSNSRYADVILRLSTREKLYSKISTFANDESIIFLLDSLYGAIFAKNYAANVRLRQEASRISESRRLPSSQIMAE